MRRVAHVEAVQLHGRGSAAPRRSSTGRPRAADGVAPRTATADAASNSTVRQPGGRARRRRRHARDDGDTVAGTRRRAWRAGGEGRGGGGVGGRGRGVGARPEQHRGEDVAAVVSEGGCGSLAASRRPPSPEAVGEGPHPTEVE